MYIAIPSIIAACTIIMPFGAGLVDYWGHKMSIGLACGLVLLGLTFLSFTTNWIAFLLILVICLAIAIGIGYIPVLQCGWEYYPHIKGRVNGIILCFFGLGASVFSLIGTLVVNPDNVKPDQKVEVGVVSYYYFTNDIAQYVPQMYITFVICYGVCAILAVILVRFPAKWEKPEIEERRQLFVAKLQSQKKSIEVQLINKKETVCPSVKAGLMHSKFWVLIVMNFCSVSYGIYIAAIFKNFGQSYEFDDQFLSTVGALTGIANGFSRVLWSSWSDYVGFVVVYRTILLIQLVCAGLLYYVSYYKFLYATLVCLSLSCMGGHYSLFPTITTKIFGLKVSHKIYGFVFYSFGLASLAGIFYVKILLSVSYLINSERDTKSSSGYSSL